jgi:endogenous inhibitor of DNA gyrase (YacG/DUF329 family)
MNSNQKQRIEYLRAQGESYGSIAKELGISVNTIKSFCRRNNLGLGIKKERITSKTSDTCDNCGKVLVHTPGAKKKRFCNDKCRMAWWANHPEAVNRKAIYRFICPTCKSEFQSYGNAHRKYCSRTCFALARRAFDD